MVWLGLIAAIGVACLFIFSKAGGGRKTVRAELRDARSRAAALPAEEQEKLAYEIRAAANSSYERGSKAAIDAGKDANFAHTIGVLQAIAAIVAPGRQLSDSENKQIHVESVPFNQIGPGEGRTAIIEYLVWKLFPALARQDAFAPALTQFRDWVYREAPSETDPDQFRFQMLFSMKYDWQRWLSEHRAEPQSS